MSDTFWRFGLIGYPLGHSLSPQIHQAALQASHCAGEYTLYPVPPTPAGVSQLHTLLNALRSAHLDGLNVTIPHKQTVLRLADSLTPAAQSIGAVNLLYCNNGSIVGENSDAAGFWTDFSRHYPKYLPNPGHVLVLGAGGSARAVVYALESRGWQVSVAARRLEQAQDLCIFGASVTALPLDSAALNALQDICAVINTTPVGMHPYPEGTPLPAGTNLPRNAFCYDLVYNPTPTLLIQNALALGMPAVNGIGMLIEQAAISFSRWTGLTAPTDAMRAAVFPLPERKFE